MTRLLNDTQSNHPERTSDISVGLSAEELAAVDGWREANGLASTHDAVRELVKVGLLSELSKVHQFVTAIQNDFEPAEKFGSRF